MSFHGDLLRQARHLANREPRRPRQASLRRAVSTAYYALFHLLTHEAVQLLLVGRGREPLRFSLARAFSHASMKTVAAGFARNDVSPKIVGGLNGQPIQPELANVAGAFVDLQQARHEADYDLSRRDLSFNPPGPPNSLPRYGRCRRFPGSKKPREVITLFPEGCFDFVRLCTGAPHCSCQNPRLRASEWFRLASGPNKNVNFPRVSPLYEGIVKTNA